MDVKCSSPAINKSQKKDGERKGVHVMKEILKTEKGQRLSNDVVSKLLSIPKIARVPSIPLKNIPNKSGAHNNFSPKKSINSPNSGGNSPKKLKSNLFRDSKGRVPSPKSPDSKKDLSEMENKKSVSLQDFRIISLIGKGGFGEVYLVEYIQGKQIMALKVLDKKKISNSKHQQMINEKAVLLKGNPKIFIMNLYYSFEDENYLYFAMKYCPGGSLRSLLNAIGALEEDTARIYMAEMIESVNSLHKLGFIHRDLKPENFLIDETGHLVLADFGLSKENPTLHKDLQIKESRGVKYGHSTRSSHKSILLGEQSLEELNRHNFFNRFRMSKKSRYAIDYNNNKVSPSSSNSIKEKQSKIKEIFARSSNKSANDSPNNSPKSSSSSPRTGIKNNSKISNSIEKLNQAIRKKQGKNMNVLPSYQPIVSFAELRRERQEKRRAIAFSVVGSPDYMSPEVLSEGGYGEEVDWWSMGCLFFEMLVGFPPFTANSVNEVFYNVKNWETRLPEIINNHKDEMSVSCFDLITKLLRDPENRAGVNGVQELKAHAFFKGINWNSLRNYEPPFIPILSSAEDTSYFELDEKINPNLSAENDLALKSESNSGIFKTSNSSIENLNNSIENSNNNSVEILNNSVENINNNSVENINNNSVENINNNSVENINNNSVESINNNSVKNINNNLVKNINNNLVEISDSNPIKNLNNDLTQNSNNA